ncbi:MAG: transglutaminase family protein [Candidatus Bruticola sp.]
MIHKLFSALIVIALVSLAGCRQSCNLSTAQPMPSVEDCESIKRRLTLDVSYQNLHNYTCLVSLKVPLLQNRPYRQKITDFRLTPEPDSQSRDEFGNTYAHYNKLTIQPGQFFTISQQAVVENEALVYNFSLQDWEAAAQQNSERRVFQADYWHEILTATSSEEEEMLHKLASQAAGSQKTDLYKLLSVYDFMRTNFNYGSEKAKTSFASMLKDRRLQCSDAAILTAKLLQLNGFKVRISGGLLLSTSQPREPLTHSWCEVFCPTLGYVPVDSAQGRYSYTRQSCFAKTDPNLVVWYIGDDSKGVKASEEPTANIIKQVQTKTQKFLLDSEALKLKVNHKMLTYKSCLNGSRSRLDLASALKNIQPSPQPVPGDSSSQDWKQIKQQIQANPQNISRAKFWIRQHHFTVEETKDLSLMEEPAAKMLQAWQAMFKYDWQAAEFWLSKLPQRHPDVIEARAFLYIFTIQSPRAACQLQSLSSYAMPNFMAEAICQFCSDQRLWYELDDTAALLANKLPNSYLLKIQWLRGAFKSERSASLQQSLKSLASEAPQDGYPYLVLGQLYLERNDIAQSLNMFNKACSLNLHTDEKQFIKVLKDKLEAIDTTE